MWVPSLKSCHRKFFESLKDNGLKRLTIESTSGRQKFQLFNWLVVVSNRLGAKAMGPLWVDRSCEEREALALLAFLAVNLIETKFSRSVIAFFKRIAMRGGVLEGSDAARVLLMIGGVELRSGSLYFPVTTRCYMQKRDPEMLPLVYKDPNKKHPKFSEEERLRMSREIEKAIEQSPKPKENPEWGAGVIDRMTGV